MAKAGDMSSPRLRGYLFGIILERLLSLSGFSRVDPGRECGRVREVSRGFTEVRGLGCWHHVDLPLDCRRAVAFMPPLRILGEVKFVKDPVEKSNVRSYIGVLRDIWEGSDAGRTSGHHLYTEVGVFFSASGFNAEAEKLAHAHGIRTVSYADTAILDGAKEKIVDIERRHLSVDCVKDGLFGEMTAFILALLDGYEPSDVPENLRGYVSDGFVPAVRELGDELGGIRSGFFATTDTGVVLHVLGDQPFPDSLFAAGDRAKCSVVLGTKGRGGSGWWLEFPGHDGKYYFTPPGTLGEAELFGGASAARSFRVQAVIGGINRDLILDIEELRPMI